MLAQKNLIIKNNFTLEPCMYIIYNQSITKDYNG